MNADEALILFCAFRYALGRRTYVVAPIADIIRRRADELSSRERSLIMREIEDALKADRAGAETDRHEWITTHAVLAALPASEATA